MNEIFINWVNSIEYPNCLLATSIQDFYSGVVFCEIINEKILQNQRPDFLPKIRNHNPSYYDSIYNVEMALQALTSQKAVLNIPPEIEQLKSQEVVKDDAKIIMLMKFLYSLFNPSYIEENFATVNHYEFDSTSSKNFYSTVNSQPDKILSKKPPVNPHSNNLKTLKNTPPSVTMTTSSLKQALQQPPQSHSNHNFKPTSPPEFANVKISPQQQQNSKHDLINFDQKENSLPSDFASLNNLKMIQSPSSVSSIACVQDLNHSKGMISDCFNFLQSPKPSLPCINKNSGFNSGLSSPANSKKNHEYSARDSIIMTDKEKGPVELQFLASWATEQDQKFDDLKKQVFTIENEIEGTPYFKSKSFNRLEEPIDLENKDYKLEGKFTLDSQNDEGPYEIPPRKMTKSSSVGNKLSKFKSEDSPPIITQEAKNQLLSWLKSIKVVKANHEVFDGQQLTKNCKNGYIISELINKIEKKDVLKGIIQNTEIKLNMKSNLQKIMAFLRKCRDMNPRFFNAHDQIINGNENIFWGLLNDIYRFYNKKPLPSNNLTSNHHWPLKNLSDRKSHHDTLHQNRRSSLESNLFDVSDTASFINTLRKGSPDSPVMDQENYNSTRHNEIPKIMIERVSVGNQSKRYDSPNPVKRRFDSERRTTDNNSTPRRPTQRNSYTSIHSKQNSYAYSHRGTPRDSSAKKRSAQRDTDRHWFSPREEAVMIKETKNQETEECGWTIELEHRITEWLKELGFSGFNLKGAAENSSLFNDPLRNGTMFGQLIEKVLNEKMNRLYLTPKSIDECRCNIYSVFNAINKRSIPIPIFLKGKQEAVLKGNRSVIFGLLQALKQFYGNKHSPELNFMANSCEAGGSTLPYSEQEIRLLESSILHWLYSLRLPSLMRIGIQNFATLIANMKNGLLLCELISIITKEKYLPRHLKPTTESQCLTNLQKCLEDLRKREWMGQRYLWKEKSIYDGNKFVIIGLFEDLRRFHDGLPPRMPPHYFADGPYLPDNNNKNYQSIDLRKPLDDPIFETIENNVNTLNLFSTETINRNSFSGFANHESESRNKIPPSISTINSRYYSTTQRNSSLTRPPSATKKEGATHRESLNDYQMILKKNFSSGRLSARKYLENSTSTRSPSASKENNHHSESKSNTFSQGFYRNLVNRSRPPSTDKKPAIQNTKELVMEYKLKQWLISLDIPGLPRDSNFEFSDLPRLADGILLIKILEKLERKKMHNITLNPTSKRDCITNIKMCLKNLTLNSKIRHFDPKFEEKLIRGDINSFKELFLTLMEIYP